MAKHLLIVESPAKAKTIEKYLGTDYQVLSSYGHIRDLPKSGLNIDIEHGFEPTYTVTPDKTKVVRELKKAIKDKQVLLATDEDREGEAISWHLCEALGLDAKTTPRIVFHEITKEALTEAVKNPRKLDLHLVDAQQARRVLDRLVGYELSPVIWKKIRPGLSAGRVQSVAVRLIVEREKEIDAFTPVSQYKVIAEFTNGNEQFTAELKDKLKDQKTVTTFLEQCKDAQFVLNTIEQKPAQKSPSAPFTTSTLQQAASSQLGFSVRQTMVLAQKLYEAGKITYMRTDSVNLSDQAVKQASRYITQTWGSEYLENRTYKSKSANAQEAHEAIRPTDFTVTKASSDAREQKLYKLIHARALASQMSSAKIERTVFTIHNNRNTHLFVAKGEVIVFDGFLKVYGKMIEDTILPQLKEGDSLEHNTITARETFDRPPARYSEASLVKKLESEGIGRPSTYAPTISTIQYRGYVLKESREGTPRVIQKLILQGDKITTQSEEENTGVEKNKLFPTDTGVVVTDFLTKHFADIVDYQFTATVENEFDQVATGTTEWKNMIADFYKTFHPQILKSEDISRHEANQGRILGNDPKSGKPVIARLGRYGAMIQIGQAEDEEKGKGKPRFAPMPQGAKIDTVTLEEALKMFVLPRDLGKTEQHEPIEVNIGRFGPYVKYASTYVSIKDEDPFSITREEALVYIAAKKKAEKEKVIQDFTKEDIQVLNGRYGPYITDGTTNVKVPKDIDPKKLSSKDAQQMLQDKLQKPRKKR